MLAHHLRIQEEIQAGTAAMIQRPIIIAVAALTAAIQAVTAGVAIVGAVMEAVMEAVVATRYIRCCYRH